MANTYTDSETCIFEFENAFFGSKLGDWRHISERYRRKTGQRAALQLQSDYSCSFDIGRWGVILLNVFLILVERNSEFRYRERNSDTFDLSDHTNQAGYNKSSVDVDNRKSALVAFRNSEKQLEQNKTTI